METQQRILTLESNVDTSMYLNSLCLGQFLNFIKIITTRVIYEKYLSLVKYFCLLNHRTCYLEGYNDLQLILSLWVKFMHIYNYTI